MRLFTGLALDPAVTTKLAALLDALRPTATVHWSPVENLHITTKFIGAWPDDRLPALQAALSAINFPGPIPIAVSRFGFFPNPHQPNSFFAGVQASTALTDLADTIDRTLTSLGCAPETKPYRPHVTLARIKRNPDIRELREHIAAMTDFNFGAFHTTAFHLYLSQPTSSGSTYTKLATYDLMREKK